MSNDNNIIFLTVKIKIMIELNDKIIEDSQYYLNF